VRTGTGCFGRFTLFKIVERRHVFQNRQEKLMGDQLVVTFDSEPYRAVNSARIWENGILEIRVFSQRDAIDYLGLANAVFLKIEPFLSANDFWPKSTDSFKQLLWDKQHRSDVQKEYSVKTSNLRNLSGNKIAAASGPLDQSMLDDPKLVASIDQFNDSTSGTAIERATFSFKAEGSSKKLGRNIGILLSGEPHEFTIGSRITSEEYEHILQRILEALDK
jgi:hypothetical protein